MAGHRYTTRRGYAMLDKLGIILLIGLGVLLLIGCSKQESGPAEQVGKEIDKATVAVGKQLEKAGEKIQEAGKADAP